MNIQSKYSAKKKSARYGFTLVELIVVITILVILGTIGFVSLQDYSGSARDGNRLSTLKNIETGLRVFNTKTWTYPETESGVIIFASWVTIGYQGYFWDSPTRLIKLSSTPLDPLDNNRYTYSTNALKTKYQMMWYFEWSSQLSFINNAYAADYTLRNPRSFWSNLGVLHDLNNTPIQNLGLMNLDIVTTTGSYKSYLDNSLSWVITWTWIALRNSLSTIVWPDHQSCNDLLKNNPSTINIDGYYKINPNWGQVLDVFCDMSYNGGWWTLVYFSNSGSVARTSLDNEDMWISPNSTFSLLWSMKNTKTNWLYEFKLVNDLGTYNHFTQTNSYNQNPINNSYTKKAWNFVFNGWGIWYGLALWNYWNTEMNAYCTLSTSYQGASWWNCLQDQTLADWNTWPWSYAGWWGSNWVKIFQR